MADNRVTLRKRQTYRTKSNRTKCVRTPGGKLTVHYLKKRVNRPHCPETGEVLNGIPQARATALHRLSKNEKRVSRVYGGMLSMKAVRSRILRAFLMEESKEVKRITRDAARLAKKNKK
eukprot:gnl/Dysnectes_brevis/144_a169_12481.p2 GENE.gnl/Dysnectes_brevis/144_a169_12481~~gnl/Dysnectes_brevis/144_a169_12481.p2  ORF type:complete len:119 (-),score=33.26 gnl/Dysnectes_brevis/144_a169_12481:52-408(-)